MSTLPFHIKSVLSAPKKGHGIRDSIRIIMCTINMACGVRQLEMGEETRLMLFARRKKISKIVDPYLKLAEDDEGLNWDERFA